MRSTITSRPATSRPGKPRPGFTITELLITVALIAVLLGFLLPALGGVWSQGAMTKSMSNLKQIATWMQLYSSDSTDHVLPSRFHYDPDAGYPGQVRSNQDPATGEPHSGTWADILQSGYSDAIYADAAVSPLANDYKDDSPDRPLYDLLGESAVKNPFRSVAKNTRNFNDRASGSLPLPYGPGADEASYPGFFAANNYFDAGWPGSNETLRWATNGQIRFPSQSMYLVDSWAGEIIEDIGRSFDPDDRDADGLPDWEVDFRYGSGDQCLMLFLDGHNEPQGPWQAWTDLIDRQIRISGLHTRAANLLYN